MDKAHFCADLKLMHLWGKFLPSRHLVLKMYRVTPQLTGIR
jgi:hypothetical protein